MNVSAIKDGRGDVLNHVAIFTDNTALKARLAFLDINQEREFGYAGYQGMLELVRQLALTMESPVRQAVRTPAPWRAASPPRAATEPVASDLDNDETNEAEALHA